MAKKKKKSKQQPRLNSKSLLKKMKDHLFTTLLFRKRVKKNKMDTNNQMLNLIAIRMVELLNKKQKRSIAKLRKKSLI